MNWVLIAALVSGLDFVDPLIGTEGTGSEYGGLGGKKGEKVRRSAFEFVTGFEGDDAQVVAADLVYADGKIEATASAPFTLVVNGRKFTVASGREVVEIGEKE